MRTLGGEMTQLPTSTNATKSRLDAIEFPGRRGNTIAMSTIGDPCVRRLWMKFHWVGPVEVISLRLRNLFDTGTRAEDFIVKDLERIGIKVTNRQEELWGFMDHAHGYTDGRCENVPDAPKTQHLLEIKTHNDKYFNTLKKKGVEKGFPKHYAQCQRYMRGTKLTRTLYIGYNKNTSEYYVERLRYDASFCDDLDRVEQQVIMTDEAPKKIFERSWFECKFCELHANCHDGAPPAKNCRTCIHVDRQTEGRWICTHPSITGEPISIPKEIQLEGCQAYIPFEIGD
jgi:hypothetical protein